jgi:outer membrane protein OmpA-like peptidoglycan-associated protein
MKHSKLLALATVATIGLAIAPAHADQYGNNHYSDRTAGGFTSHHLVEEEDYHKKAEQLPADEKLELREFLDYETREPCQFYQPIPQGFMRDGCHLRPIPQETTKVVIEEPKEPVKVSNVLTDYEINFAFDSAAIEPAAGNTIDQIASEIKRYNPRDVVVAGFTDTSGPADYNVKLSERRAEAVSNALTDRGVENRVIDQKAFGETNTAVKTGDDVQLREKRRVMVEFRK